MIAALVVSLELGLLAVGLLSQALLAMTTGVAVASLWGSPEQRFQRWQVRYWSAIGRHTLMGVVLLGLSAYVGLHAIRQDALFPAGIGPWLAAGLLAMLVALRVRRPAAMAQPRC